MNYIDVALDKCQTLYNDSKPRTKLRDRYSRILCAIKDIKHTNKKRKIGTAYNDVEAWHFKNKDNIKDYASSFNSRTNFIVCTYNLRNGKKKIFHIPTESRVGYANCY